MMAECFPLTYGLNSFKPRVNRHLPHFSLLRRWGSAPTSHSTSWKFPHSPTSKKNPSRLPPTHQIFIAPPPTKGSSFPPADKKVPSQQNSPPPLGGISPLPLNVIWKTLPFILTVFLVNFMPHSGSPALHRVNVYTVISVKNLFTERINNIE